MSGYSYQRTVWALAKLLNQLIGKPLRKERLTDVMIQKRFRSFMGEPSAEVASMEFEGDYAVKFLIGASHMTVKVKHEDMHRGIASFSRKYLGQVCKLFRDSVVDEPERFSGPMAPAPLAGRAQAHNAEM